MSRFNRPVSRPPQVRGSSPVQTVPGSAGHTATALGGVGYRRDAKGELFLLAVSNINGADAATYHESAGGRDGRFLTLVSQLAVEDPAWTFNLFKWLRGPEGNLRTASLVGAAAFVAARLQANKGTDPAGWNRETASEAALNGGWNRRVVDAVCQRADEPGEFLAYWTAMYGRNVPKPVKRGLADAVRRLYNERSLLKYDTASHGYRFADVLELVHAAPHPDKAAWQGHLFQHALDRRHRAGVDAIPEQLTMLTANAYLRKMVAAGHVRWLTDAQAIQDAGMTWEDVFSLAGDKVSKAKLWKALASSMGYMALIRNLRNMEEAAIDANTRHLIVTRLTDPDEVARSRQLPFRFWSSYKATNSLQFQAALEAGLDLSLPNIPTFDGPSLTLVDTSASMRAGLFAQRSTMSPVQAGALFGVALAAKDPNNELWGFASNEFRQDVPRGASVLPTMQRFVARVGEVGHGTDIHGAVQRRFRPGHHRRVFIISDMQTIGGHYGVGNGVVPTNVPIYGFNLSGNAAAMMQTGVAGRHEFGGLTDATWKQVVTLERGVSSGWPWDQQ